MIKIICCGKLKEAFWQSAINEYTKRISKYAKVQIIELKDSNITQEKDEILKYIDKRDYIITLEILGNNLTSLEFAHKIEDLQIHYPNITFIIGGSDGLHDDIKKLSSYPLSFSSLTFPHQLFRIMLLEQIYRCYKIINNETYHK